MNRNRAIIPGRRRGNQPRDCLGWFNAANLAFYFSVTPDASSYIIYPILLLCAALGSFDWLNYGRIWDEFR